MGKALEGLACSVAITIAILAIMVVALTGCGKGRIVRIENDKVDVFYKEVTIDHCQYIIRGQGICHKGNCTNHLDFKR